MLFKLALFGTVLTISGIGFAVFSTSHPDVISKISIEKLVKENSDWGLICDETDGHGPRVSAQGIGPADSRNHRKEVLTCRKAPATSSFDEDAFLSALKTAVEKEITDRGGKIAPNESSHASSFFLEYTAGKTRGRIDVACRSIGTSLYNLEATIAEIKTQ